MWVDIAISARSLAHLLALLPLEEHLQNLFLLILVNAPRRIDGVVRREIVLSAASKADGGVAIRCNNRELGAYYERTDGRDV